MSEEHVNAVVLIVAAGVAGAEYILSGVVRIIKVIRILVVLVKRVPA